MTNGAVKLAHEDVRVAEVTVRSPFGRLVLKVGGDLQPFRVIVDGPWEVAQEIVHVAKVSTGSTLSCPVSDLQHQDHVLLVVLDGFLEECFHLLWEFSRILMAQSANVLALKKIDHSLATTYSLQ